MKAYLKQPKWLVFLFPVLCAPACLAVSVTGDEAYLRQRGYPVQGAALVTLIRQSTPGPEEAKNIADLVEQLGSRSFRKREAASTALIRLGEAARAALTKATESSDKERARRAKACLALISETDRHSHLRAAVRILGHRPAKGAAQALLNLAPFAAEEGLQLDVLESLTQMAKSEKDNLEILRNGLKAPAPLTRAMAAVALCRAGGIDHLPWIKKLLKDPDPVVRARVSIDLAILGEKDAIPVLIDLIAILPPGQIWKAEDLLLRIAGDKPPKLTGKKDPASLKKDQQAWTAWWDKRGSSIDLRLLKGIGISRGFTLVVLMDKGHVVELDRNDKERWRITGLRTPLDAQVLPGGRALVAECNASEVTERTFKGEIVWRKKLPSSPIRAHRLPDGRTFIVTRKRILYVDRAGNETVVYDPGKTINTGRRFPNGNIGCVVGGYYLLLDPEGKERKRFPLSASITSSLDTLANGNILAAEYGGGRVAERDASGRVLWSAPVTKPISTVRLSNGNTLTSSQDGYFIEHNRSGKVVKKTQVAGHPTQVRRR